MFQKRQKTHYDTENPDMFMNYIFDIHEVLDSGQK